MNRPIMQRCTLCGVDWWGSHFCTPPEGTLEKLVSLLPPAPLSPQQQGLRLPPSQVTEADVRRIVREELQRAASGATPARKEAFDHQAFTDALYQCIRNRGLTAKEVAEATGVSGTTLSRMQVGRQPDAASLAALAAWAGINPARFMKPADPAISQDTQAEQGGK